MLEFLTEITLFYYTYTVAQSDTFVLWEFTIYSKCLYSEIWQERLLPLEGALRKSDESKLKKHEWGS